MKKWENSILIIVFISSVIFGTKLLFSDMGKMTISENAIVRIHVIAKNKSERIAGTGFFIEHDQVITNRHVVEKVIQFPEMYQVYGCVQKTAKVQCNTLHYFFEIIPTEGSEDLALLKISQAKHLGEWKPVALLPKKRHTFLSIEKISTEVKSVFVVGYSNATGKIVQLHGGMVGYFSENKNLFHIAQIPVNYGNSGSPVVTSNGELVGVVSSCVVYNEEKCSLVEGVFIPIQAVSSWYTRNISSEFLARD